MLKFSNPTRRQLTKAFEDMIGDVKATRADDSTMIDWIVNASACAYSVRGGGWGAGHIKTHLFGDPSIRLNVAWVSTGLDRHVRIWRS